MPGDKVQIINGVLFVNDRNVDSGLTLLNYYIAPARETQKLDEEFQKDINNAVPIGNSDSMRLRLNTAVYKERSIIGRLMVDTSIIPQSMTVFKHAWTVDNFGPLRVPAGKYFVLGDNRHESADSRILGFVDAKDYLGVVVKIF
jgi:signal peptidase I